MLAALVSVNVFDVIQGVRESDAEQREFYKLMRESYKDIVNMDLEQRDFFWHFVDVFFNKCANQLNHTCFSMIDAWLELSYY